MHENKIVKILDEIEDDLYCNTKDMDLLINNFQKKYDEIYEKMHSLRREISMLKTYIETDQEEMMENLNKEVK